MFLWIFLNFRSRSFAACSKPTRRENHRKGRNNVTRVRVEPRPCDQGHRNDAFALSARSRQ